VLLNSGDEGFPRSRGRVDEVKDGAAVFGLGGAAGFDELEYDRGEGVLFEQSALEKAFI